MSEDTFIGVALVFFVVGTALGWPLTPYFISDLDRFANSPFDLWSKKLGVAFGFGFVSVLVGISIFEPKDNASDNKELVTISANATDSISTLHNDNAPVKTKSSSPQSSVAQTNSGNHLASFLKDSAGMMDAEEIERKKQAALEAAHPACAHIFRQEEENHGDNNLQCSVQELESADLELNRTYKVVMAKLSSERKASLKQEELAWIKEKEHRCDEVVKNAFVLTPRFQDSIRNFCLAELTKERTAYLKNIQ